MTEEQANEAISQHWAAAWLAAHGPLTADPVTCVYEGNPAPSAAEWVRFAIVPSVSALQTLDARQRERTGFLSVQVFTSPIGTRRSSQLIDSIRTVLEAQVIDEGIWTDAATASPGLADGAWTMRLVTVPFRWYA
ncbi:MAG: hypothetical protein M3R55_10255 [Acidobacteriota bacterium]|nr:hypothetical protein [Acidobacteriota bacterium]